MFDFSQYEQGFREYQKQNPLGIQGVGFMAEELPGGLRLNDTGEIKQFSDYMQSIGAGNYYNQYMNTLPTDTSWSGPATLTRGLISPIQPGVGLQTAQPIKKMFDFSQYEPGFREYLKQNPTGGGGKQMITLPGNLTFYDTGEQAAFRDYMQSIGAGDYYNQYMNTHLTTGFPSKTPTISTTPAIQPSASIPQATTVPSVGLQTAQPSVNIPQAGASNMAEDTTTTTSGLSQFAQPYAEYGLAEALRQYQAGAPAYYPGQTYTEFAPQTEQALRAAEQRALAGSPVMQAGQDYLQQVLSGGFLGGSPGLEAAIQRATQPAQAAAMSGLAQRGRLGSGLGSQAVAQTVGDIAAEMSYQDYLNERTRQQQALQFAPTYAQADYYDIGQLGQVGAAREAQAQKAINEAMARYQYEQNAPQQQLGQFMDVVYGFPGKQQTTVAPLYEPSFGQQFLGGAAAFGSLYGENTPFMDRLPGLIAGGLLANVQVF